MPATLPLPRARDPGHSRAVTSLGTPGCAPGCSLQSQNGAGFPLFVLCTKAAALLSCAGLLAAFPVCRARTPAGARLGHPQRQPMDTPARTHLLAPAGAGAPMETQARLPPSPFQREKSGNFPAKPRGGPWGLEPLCPWAARRWAEPWSAVGICADGPAEQKTLLMATAAEFKCSLWLR